MRSQRPSPFGVAVAFAAVVIFFTGLPGAFAATMSWKSAASGQFSTASCWNTGVPGASDSAVLGVAGSYTVTLTISPSNQSLVISAGTATLTSSGGSQTYNLTSGASPATIVGSTLNLGTAGNPLHLNLYSATGTPYLTVGSAAALNVFYGSHVSAQNLSMAQGSGTSTITVDAAGATGSYLNCSGAVLISGSGGTGNITYQNGATGACPGGISLITDANAADSATFTVQSGAAVTTGGLNLATSGASGQTAIMTVTDGSSSIAQIGASILTVGSTTSGTATLNVNSGGTFSSGTGLTTVNKTGTISVNGGTYNVNGNLTINGGAVVSSDTGTLNCSGTTITITNSGRLSYGTANTAISVHLPASVTVTGAGSRLETPGFLDVASQLSITNGGALRRRSSYSGPASPARCWSMASTRNLCAPRLLRPASGAAVARASRRRSVTPRRAVFPTMGFLWPMMAAHTPPAPSACKAAPDLDLWQLALDRNGGDGSSAMLTVTGAGSEASASYMTRIGHDSTGVGVLTVNNGGSFTSVNTELRATGEVDINGGAVSLGLLSQLGGHVYIGRGALSYTGNLTVGPGRAVRRSRLNTEHRPERHAQRDDDRQPLQPPDP